MCLYLVYIRPCVNCLVKMFNITVFFSGSFRKILKVIEEDVLRVTEEDSISLTAIWPILLAHLSQRLIGEFIGYCRPSSSVIHNAQRSSSPKPLCQSKPNFMWSLLGQGERYFVRGIGVTSPRSPYMVKTQQKFLFQNRRADFHETWYVALGDVASGTPTHYSMFK